LQYTAPAPPCRPKIRNRAKTPRNPPPAPHEIRQNKNKRGRLRPFQRVDFAFTLTKVQGSSYAKSLNIAQRTNEKSAHRSQAVPCRKKSLLGSAPAAARGLKKRRGIAPSLQPRFLGMLPPPL
jgi:hypothetical protein